MPKIRVVNLKNYVKKEGEILIKVDRSNKIIGNKFRMHNESERNEVCDKYEEWFNKKIEERDSKVINELRHIWKIAYNTNVALACWCYPKRCHAMTIERFLNKYL